ncbi:Methionine aminopeptidase, partial [hydrothermal vent metagenome]
MQGTRLITKKTDADFDKMKVAGRCVAAMHQTVREIAEPGVTTLELDSAAREVLAEYECRSSFLGYGGPTNPFPGVLCTSPNSVIVHGIPGEYRLREG